MKDARPFEGIVSDTSSSEVSDRKRLSVLSWNAGQREKQSREQHGGIFPRDPGPRGGDALPRYHNKLGATILHQPPMQQKHF